uniref:MFS transporter n=1 Tax=Pantoea sp. GbtcB22 TaxID=2824767 RepID=UPI001C30B6A9
PLSLTVATVGMLLACLTVLRWRLDQDPDLNLDLSTVSGPLPELEIRHDRGPVMVSYHYQVNRSDAHAFAVCMQDMGGGRRRGGALNWS